MKFAVAVLLGIKTVYAQDGHITLEHMTKHSCGNTPMGAKGCDEFKDDMCCGRITNIDYTSAENWKILTDSGDQELI
jgi:hypothetical protein